MTDTVPVPPPQGDRSANHAPLGPPDETASAIFAVLIYLVVVFGAGAVIFGIAALLT